MRGSLYAKRAGQKPRGEGGAEDDAPPGGNGAVLNASANGARTLVLTVPDLRKPKQDPLLVLRRSSGAITASHSDPGLISKAGPPGARTRLISGVSSHKDDEDTEDDESDGDEEGGSAPGEREDEMPRKTHDREGGDAARRKGRDRDGARRQSVVTLGETVGTVGEGVWDGKHRGGPATYSMPKRPAPSFVRQAKLSIMTLTPIELPVRSRYSPPAAATAQPRLFFTCAALTARVPS